MRIHRIDIQRDADRWLPDIRLDGVEAYRERPKYGNQHVLHVGSGWFVSHEDQHNAYDVPVGTVNHVAHWAHEKTGINESVLKVTGWAMLLYGAYRLTKSIT